MLLRLTPLFGGDGTIHGIIVMHDTGSDVLTLFDIDLLQLGNSHGYTGWQLPADIMDASGRITSFRTLYVQVQLVRDDNTPWSEWIDEFAIVKRLDQGVPRLSGVGIRHALYIGTAPGNHLLAMSATKGGLTSLL